MPALSLALHFIRRDIRNRYLGSFSGGLWALLQPLIQLAVYGFVFVYVFKARVPGADAPGYVPFLALGLWHTLLYATTNACLWAVGKPQYVTTGYFLSAIVVLAVTPLTFHQWGLPGFVWTVAFSDVPMYCVTLFGLGREGMFPALQDLKATLLFVLICGVLIAIRMAAGVHFPHPVALP